MSEIGSGNIDHVAETKRLAEKVIQQGSNLKNYLVSIGFQLDKAGIVVPSTIEQARAIHKAMEKDLHPLSQTTPPVNWRENPFYAAVASNKGQYLIVSRTVLEPSDERLNEHVKLLHGDHTTVHEAIGLALKQSEVAPASPMVNPPIMLAGVASMEPGHYGKMIDFRLAVALAASLVGDRSRPLVIASTARNVNSRPDVPSSSYLLSKRLQNMGVRPIIVGEMKRSISTALLVVCIKPDSIPDLLNLLKQKINE